MRVGSRVMLWVGALCGMSACGTPSASSLFSHDSTGVLIPTGGTAGAAGSVTGGSTSIGGTGGTIGKGGAGGTSTGGTSTGGTSTGGTGTAGSSNGGGTSVCSKATGALPMIDDFEDRDANILPNEGRSGAWTVWNDGTSWQQPTNALPSFIPMGGRSGSLYAMHTWGGIFTVWGAAVGFDLDQCTDASVYSGVKFWLFGNVPVTFAVVTPGTLPVASGGTCTGTCWGHFARKVTPSPNKWTQFIVKWNDLAQPNWATPAPFDVTHLMGMQFGLDAADLANLPPNATFDAWIDDVQFY